MKTINISFLSIILVLLFGSSCFSQEFKSSLEISFSTEQTSSDNGTFTINFDIQDTTRKEISVGYNKNMGFTSVNKYIPVKSKDSTYCIIDSINQPFTAYINIDEIQLPIWVEPNSSLNIAIVNDTITYSGKSKIYGDYYSKSKDYWLKIYTDYWKRNQVLEGRPIGFEYFTVQDSITYARIDFLESFFTNPKSTSNNKFIEHEKNNLLYSDVFFKISGLNSLNDFSFFQSVKNEPSDTFLTFTNKIEFNNPDLFNIDQYRRCFEWLPNKYIKNNGLDYYKNMEEAYDFVISLPKNELCKKYIEVILLNKFIVDSKEIQDYALNSLIEKRFAILENNRKGIETYLHILQIKYIELLESEKKSKENISLLKNKEFSEGIKLRDFSSSKGADFLRTIIQKYPGKVLYVDIWAPWCGPCMKEMFYSNELQKKYENNEVEFIYLGVSCNKDAWESSIARRKLTGEHYFLEDEQRDQLFKMFEFSGIPRYLIINKKGIVVNSNAPRPSNVEKLNEIFSKMLE